MAQPVFNAHSAALQLREAMKGFGTDDNTLIRVIANLNSNQIQPLIESYAKDIGRDLKKDIADETSRHFEEALLAFLVPPLQYDAERLRAAMKGVGTDDSVLIDIICTRPHAELKEIIVQFKRLYEHDLVEDIKSETSGDYRKVLIARLTNADDAKADIDRDVELLYKAGQGKIGTDDAVFVNILTARSKDYLVKLNTAYATKHGKALSAVIDSEMSGQLKKALLAIVTPPVEWFTDRIHEAVAGAGTNDSLLIRIIASMRFRGLKAIADRYLNLYKKGLKARIADEVSGDYKRLMVAAIEHSVEGRYAMV